MLDGRRKSGIFNFYLTRTVLRGPAEQQRVGGQKSLGKFM
jgi:hypothetical protein